MQEEGPRVSIDPYYKKGNIFERDEAYYSQMLSGTRRTLRGNRSPSKDRSGHSANPSSYDQDMQVSKTFQITTRSQQLGPNFDRTSKVEGQAQHVRTNNNDQYQQALFTNAELKAELERMLSGDTTFGHSDNVVKLSHYNNTQSEMGKVKEQELEVRRMEEEINANAVRIQKMKKAGDQLATRVHNIQSIDKEIYKTLQGSVNRDKQLLDKACTALARGEKRQEIARILQQIIG